MHSPTDAIKSVGLQASAIEELEVKLKQDAVAEAAACDSRILLHCERAALCVEEGSDSGGSEYLVEPFWYVDQTRIIALELRSEQETGDCGPYLHTARPLRGTASAFSPAGYSARARADHHFNSARDSGRSTLASRWAATALHRAPPSAMWTAS